MLATGIAGLGLVTALGATVAPPPTVGTQPGASLTVYLPVPVKIVVIALFAASMAILLGLLRRPPLREDEPEREDQRLSRRAGILGTLPLVLMAILIWYLVHDRVGIDGGPAEGPFVAISQLLDLLAGARKPAASIPLLDVAFAVAVVLLAVGVFALMVLVALAEPLARWRAAPPQEQSAAAVHEALDESLDDLRSVPDARAAILRVYRHFERALSDARAPRAPWQTPSEFMRAALMRLPVPPGPIQRLTALFELARFSDRPLGVEARDTACDCLAQIQLSLREAARES